MLIVLAISGAIITAVSAVILQTFSVSAANNNRMTAIKQLENALHWIDRDAQQSWVQDVSIDPLYMHWIDNVVSPVQEHDITYNLDNTDGTLTRIDVVTEHDGTVNTLNTLIAEYISDINYTYVQNPNGKYLLTVNITANVEGYRSATESRTLCVMPRASRVEE
jgi:type II secretory pathway pseudopilin PulG